MSRDSVKTIHDTYASRMTGTDPYQSGPITAASSGAPYPMANNVFIFEPPSSDELEEAVSWMREQEVPFWVNVADDALPTIEDFADDYGLQPRDMMLSGMLRPTLDELPTADSNAEISEVTTRDDLEAYFTVFDEVFDIQLERELPEEVDDSGTNNRSSYIGRVDGRPVATGATVWIDDVANVAGMAVLEEFRGRGIGTTICIEALQAAREAGCELATLESSPMAVSLYESLGFETHVNYHLFQLRD